MAGLHVELLPNQSRIEALSIQFLGIIVVGSFVFLCTFSILKIANRLFGLRVSEDAELVGLNVYEHGVVETQLELMKHMSEQIKSGDFATKAAVDSQSSSHSFASYYNKVLAKFSELQNQKDRTVR